MGREGRPRGREGRSRRRWTVWTRDGCVWRAGGGNGVSRARRHTAKTRATRRGSASRRGARPVEGWERPVGRGRDANVPDDAAAGSARSTRARGCGARGERGRDGAGHPTPRRRWARRVKTRSSDAAGRNARRAVARPSARVASGPRGNRACDEWVVSRESTRAHASRAARTRPRSGARRVLARASSELPTSSFRPALPCQLSHARDAPPF